MRWSVCIYACYKFHNGSSKQVESKIKKKKKKERKKKESYTKTTAALINPTPKTPSTPHTPKRLPPAGAPFLNGLLELPDPLVPVLVAASPLAVDGNEKNTLLSVVLPVPVAVRAGAVEVALATTTLVEAVPAEVPPGNSCEEGRSRL